MCYEAAAATLQQYRVPSIRKQAQLTDHTNYLPRVPLTQPLDAPPRLSEQPLFKDFAANDTSRDGLAGRFELAYGGSRSVSTPLDATAGMEKGPSGSGVLVPLSLSWFERGRVPPPSCKPMPSLWFDDSWTL